MSKQELIFGKDSHTIALQQKDGQYLLTISESTYSVDLASLAKGEGILYFNRQAVPFYCARLDSQTIQLWIEGRYYEFEKVDTQARRGSGGAASQVAGDIKAPMPGTILKIKVAEGDIVEENQAVVIMESMKMEMSLTSPARAKVVKLNCAEAQLVDMGAVLVKLEPVE